MIHIIEYGGVYKTVCGHCGCKFSYESEDMQAESEYHTDEVGKLFRWTYVLCPQCQKHVPTGPLYTK